MSDDQSVFDDSNDNQGNPLNNDQQGDVFANQLADIKNDQGSQKYSSTGEALTALKHSQEYIPQLKSELQVKQEELDKVKAELETRTKVEDAIKGLTADQPQDQGSQDQGSQLNEESILGLVNKVLDNKQEVSVKTSNRNKVQDALKTRFGEKTSEVIAAKALELNTTSAELGKIAESSPSMVLELFKPKGNVSTPNSSTSFNIPPLNTDTNPVQRPKKSMLSGATSREQIDHFREIKQEVYNQYGITT